MNVYFFSHLISDYVFGNRKFGGNAQSIIKNRWIHHTSFLWDYEVRNMAYLKLPVRAPEYRLVMLMISPIIYVFSFLLHLFSCQYLLFISVLNITHRHTIIGKKNPSKHSQWWVKRTGKSKTCDVEKYSLVSIWSLTSD